MASRNTGQRVGIWIIAIVMTVGTIGSFLVIILANSNQKLDQTRLSDLSKQYSDNQAEYQKKVDAQANELSATYFDTFNQYAHLPAAFNAADVTTLVSEDIKVGDGATIEKDQAFTAYYIGWNPSGVVFDGSIDGSKLKAPFTAAPGSVITGWSEGVIGMKVGGVRILTIPSDKAYGATGSGENIPANTPLKFVMMVIPTPETIPPATIPAELLKYYSQNAS
jgi:FKBP-type peptidyl-prolyl cis-trans isomerase